MDKRIGFIGAGNMGFAMINSISKSGIISAGDILVYDIDKKRLLELEENIGVCTVQSERELTEKSDIIILAVKPNIIKTTLDRIKTGMNDKKILISVAVGIPIKFYKDILGQDKKVVRTMPNTPALVGEG